MREHLSNFRSSGFPLDCHCDCDGLHLSLCVGLMQLCRTSFKKDAFKLARQDGFRCPFVPVGFLQWRGDSSNRGSIGHVFFKNCGARAQLQVKLV